MERICLLKYTRADIHVKRPRCAAAARRARTLLSWTSAVVNGPTGGPELAQIVTVRDIGEEAQIAHLELTDQARAIVGHELVSASRNPGAVPTTGVPSVVRGFAPSVMVTATGLGPTKFGGIRMRRRATLIALVVALVGAALAGAAPALAITGGSGHRPYERRAGPLHPPDGRFRCSGTLISPTVVLTAGHCTEGATNVYVSFDTRSPA